MCAACRGKGSWRSGGEKGSTSNARPSIRWTSRRRPKTRITTRSWSCRARPSSNFPHRIRHHENNVATCGLWVRPADVGGTPGLGEMYRTVPDDDHYRAALERNEATARRGDRQHDLQENDQRGDCLSRVQHRRRAVRIWFAGGCESGAGLQKRV
ncbi:hypothetical protein D3C78_1500050 [compost metagenome]